MIMPEDCPGFNPNFQDFSEFGDCLFQDLSYDMVGKMGDLKRRDGHGKN
jgi:hypothetical protein